jgi:hypothetical protein
MSDTIPLHSVRRGRFWKWLLLAAVVALLILLFARKITQLSLPGLDVAPKTIVVDPKCPTPEQKDVIEKNLNVRSNVTSEQNSPLWPENGPKGLLISRDEIAFVQRNCRIRIFHPP